MSDIEYIDYTIEDFDTYEIADEQSEYKIPLGDTEGLTLLTTQQVAEWNEIDPICITDQQNKLREVIENHLNGHHVAIKCERMDLEDHKGRIDFIEDFSLLDFENKNDLKNGMDIYMNEESDNLTIFVYGGNYTHSDNPKQNYMEITKCEFYCDEERNDKLIEELMDTKEKLMMEVEERTDYLDIVMG